MNVRLRYTMPFSAGVYYGGEMRINQYTATVYMTTNTHDPANHNVAFERIKYFVYEQLDSSIFINSDHQDQCERFAAAGLSVTTMPGDPVDQLIGLMLYHKLNAIMEDRIVVDETEISSVLGESMVYLHSGNEHTDVEHFPDWWTSEDPTNSDYTLPAADKVVTMHNTQAWRELELSWLENNNVTETGNIVVFADFKSDHDTK
jgi:hypothetical protein